MFIIVGGIFFLFTLVYAFLAAAIVYHLSHYTLPDWTAARIVAPAFFILSAILFIIASYSFLRIPWEQWALF